MMQLCSVRWRSAASVRAIAVWVPGQWYMKVLTSLLFRDSEGDLSAWIERNIRKEVWICLFAAPHVCRCIKYQPA